MKLNLTDIFIQGAEILEGHDAQILNEALQDIDRLDESTSLLEAHGAEHIILDIDAEYFTLLQEALPEHTLTLGVVY